MEDHIELRGVTYKFRDILKEEHDKWNSVWNMERVWNQVMSLANGLVELDNKVAKKEIKEDVYKMMYAHKLSMMEDLRRKYMDAVKLGEPTRQLLADASKLILGVFEPKLTIEDCIKMPNEVFDTLFHGMESYQMRDAIVSDEKKIEKFREMLSEYPRPSIEVKEVLLLLDNIEQGLTLKKNSSP